MPCQDYASACMQGTPLTPMDISPQQFTDAATSAPTPPPQPSFTPQAAAPPKPIFQFNFGTSASQSAPNPTGVKPSPRGKKPTAKPAADLPKSNLGMPPKASAGSSGSGSGFGGPAQAQASSTGSAAAAGFAAQPASHSAMPNSFSTCQAAPSGFFASGIGGPSTAMPFAVPGRLMDSRIPDACAMGFMGINLDSAPTHSSFSAQPAAATHAATAGAQPAAAGASFASQPPPRAAFPDTHATHSTFAAGTSGSYAERGNLGSASSRPSTQEASFGSSGGSASAAEGQAPAAAQAAPPSPYSFTMGAAVNPKQHFGRTIFGSEHLATNLHDKLVLEEQLAAAAAAGCDSSEAGRAAPAAANQTDARHASSAEVPFQAEAPAGAADHQAHGPASTSSGTAPQHAAQRTAARGTSTATAAAESAAAPAAAAPPPFVFGFTSASAAPSASGAGAADSGSHAQPQGFAFGTTHSSAFFAQQAAAQPAQAKPFVFGTSSTSSASSTASTQPKHSARYPSARFSAGASQPAPVSQASEATTSGVPAPSAPDQVNAIPARSGLHSLSGVAKHTSSRGSAGGAGLQNRAVAGSPQARRTRASPRKQTSPQVRACQSILKSLQKNKMLHSSCSFDLCSKVRNSVT